MRDRAELIGADLTIDSTPGARTTVRPDGLSNEQIASRLSISQRTQRNHIANILRELGVHSQLQAVMFALRHSAVHVR
jgi:hypothetical protein